MLKKNKKGEVGTIFLMLILISAVYVINHPPKENTITIKNGVCDMENISTAVAEVAFVNEDNSNYEITINNKTEIIPKNSRTYLKFEKGVYEYGCKTHPGIKGNIEIN